MAQGCETSRGSWSQLGEMSSSSRADFVDVYGESRRMRASVFGGQDFKNATLVHQYNVSAASINSCTFSFGHKGIHMRM